MKRYIRASSGSGVPAEEHIAPASDYHHRRYGYQVPKSALMIDRNTYEDKLSEYNPKLIEIVKEYFDAHPRAFWAVVKNIRSWSNNPIEVAVSKLSSMYNGEEYKIDDTPYYPAVTQFKHLEDGTTKLNIKAYGSIKHQYDSEADAHKFIDHTTELLSGMGVTVVDSSYISNLESRAVELRIKLILE